jgi:hypothetical protein
VEHPRDSQADRVEAAIALILANPEALADLVSRSRGDGGRHDGWTGERMARFLEVLATTGIVAEAVRAAAMNRDSAYALRDRDPVFAAAWAAAQTRARPVVADGILERSISGTVEHYYRDGVLVGERRHYESWLALAVLKRLDKQAEQDRADATLSAQIAGDWQGAMDALRSGGTAAVPALFELETDETDIPPPPGSDPWEDLWKDDDGRWMTIFPPPPGFDGHENRPWDGDSYYERECTTEEAELLDAHQAAMLEQERAEVAAYAEAQRDRWFAKLRNELNAVRQPATERHLGLDPGPAFTSSPEKEGPSPQVTVPLRRQGSSPGEDSWAPAPAGERLPQHPFDSV